MLAIKVKAREIKMNQQKCEEHLIPPRQRDNLLTL